MPVLVDEDMGTTLYACSGRLRHGYNPFCLFWYMKTWVEPFMPVLVD